MLVENTVSINNIISTTPVSSRNISTPVLSNSNILGNRNVSTNNVSQRKQLHTNKRKYSKQNKIFLFGDSHLKRINKSLFNNSLKSSNKAYIKNFDGATAKRLDHFVIPFLEEENPDIALIHIGTNNINPYTLHSLDINNLANQIIAIGDKCKNYGVKEVVISSVLWQDKEAALNTIIKKDK